MSQSSNPQGVELSLQCSALTVSHTVLSASLSEWVSRPYRAEILISTEEDLKESELLSAPLVLLVQHGTQERSWAMVVDAISFLGQRNRHHTYRIEGVHPLSHLAYRANVRGFRHKNLETIVQKVLEPCGLSGAYMDWKAADDATHGTVAQYVPLSEYVVQYRETDLEFFERLLVEEGFNYHCVQQGNAPAVLIADADGDLPDSDLGDVALLSGGTGYGVTDFSWESHMEPGRYATSDYNYNRANDPLVQGVPLPDNLGGEWYEYPGGFLDAARAETLTKRRGEALVSRAASGKGRSEILPFCPGKRFRLTQIRATGDREWYLTEVVHQWVVRRDADHALENATYSNRFRVVPHTGSYRQFATRLPKTVEGPVSALITNQGNEEIVTEQQGEATARFAWDEDPPKADDATCWVRVIQIPIGGSLAVARNEWEVLVRHLYGDPNRPVLVSRVDNAGHVSPYGYPKASSGMAWKTFASPGAAKVNEFSMEDSGGCQGFSMTAGTDYMCQVNNNMTETVAVNEKITVDVDHSTTVDANHKEKIGTMWTKTVSGNTAVTVNADRKFTVGAAETVTVSGSLTEKVVGKDSEVVGASHMTLAAMSVSRSAKGTHSLSVGGALITAAGLSVSQAVGGSSSETIGGAKLVAAGGSITESVVGGFSMTVGGVIVNAAAGNCSSSSTGANKVKVGGVGLICGGKQVQILAKKITIEVGAAAALLGAGGIMALTPASASFVGMVSIKASGALKIKGMPNLPG